MKTMTLVAMALAAMAMAGCSVTTEAPIKTVAYDFSDHDFYDRSYAPSPVYGDATAMASADDRADHAKAKQVDEGDDDDQQVVVIVGHSGKVTIDQGRHGNSDDDASHKSHDRTVVVNGPEVSQPASAPVPAQPLPSGQWQPQTQPQVAPPAPWQPAPPAGQWQPQTQPQAAPPAPWQPAPPAGQWQPQAPQATPRQPARAPLPAANPGFSRH